MEPNGASRQEAAVALASRARHRPMKALWRRIRKPLAQSRFVKSAVAQLITAFLRLVYATSPRMKESSSEEILVTGDVPFIIAMWHGQHLLAPPIWPKGKPLVAMVSRSDEAELNALVIEKFGIRTVRGSGGRQDGRQLDKGGAQALIALKKALISGSHVFMIADIPHGTPREAGLGIVTLARVSGRPIIPLAIATSRRKVLEKSWDRTTIHLPFGRLAVIACDPIYVPPKADEAQMEALRAEVTQAIEVANRRAYALVDGRA